jgi:hypothetical protein
MRSEAEAGLGHTSQGGGTWPPMADRRGMAR